MRDLKAEITGLSVEDNQEFMIEDISPGRAPVTLYALSDGCPSVFPSYMVPTILSKRREDGSYAFTSDPTKAPQYHRGRIKCFLHPDSPEWPTIQELGLGGKTCASEHLRTTNSKRIHAQHRHKQEWTAYQEYLKDQKEAEQARQQALQLEATLAMAGRVTGVKPKNGRRK